MSDLGALCRACGLCCDGSLFGRVTLDPSEVETARKNRLRVLPSGASFEQPCSALGAAPDFACAAYAERPRRCREFTCKLYARHEREGGPLEARLEAVRRARELLKLAEGAPDDEMALGELRERMERDFERA